MSDWLGRLVTSGQRNDVRPITFEHARTNNVCIGFLLNEEYALFSPQIICPEQSFAQQLAAQLGTTRFALAYAQQEESFTDEQIITRTKDLTFERPYQTLFVGTTIQERPQRLGPRQWVDDIMLRIVRRKGFSDLQTEVDLEIVLESLLLLQKQFSVTLKDNRQQGYGALRKYESFDQKPQLYEATTF